MSEKEYKDKCESMFKKNAILINENEYLKQQIEKMQKDQKTAFTKGMRHLAKAMKDYDREEGAWTDYFEHAVDEVLKRELKK